MLAMKFRRVFTRARSGRVAPDGRARAIDAARPLLQRQEATLREDLGSPSRAGGTAVQKTYRLATDFPATLLMVCHCLWIASFTGFGIGT